MFGRRRRGGRGAGSGLAYPAIPAGAGLVSAQVLDPVSQPLAAAEAVVTDEAGRQVAKALTDPYGVVAAAVPAGQYRATISADGFQTHRVAIDVQAGEHTELGAVELGTAPRAQLPAPGRWRIDPAHSSVRFSARHIGLGRVHGRFNEFAGEILVRDRVEQTAMHVSIGAASIDTGTRQRDDHLRSADFLDAAHYPTLDFRSERMQHRGGSRWAIAGTLTLHGVSRNVSLDAQYLGVGTGMEGEPRVACHASTELHREDFTLNWRQMLAQGIAVVGSSIDVELDIQAIPA